MDESHETVNRIQGLSTSDKALDRYPQARVQMHIYHQVLMEAIIGYNRPPGD
jgi:hypothetical protein